MKNINDKGFTLIESLLVIIVLILLGGVGIYVINAYKVDNKLDVNNKASQSNTDTMSTNIEDKTNNAYLIIKEWGIKIPLTDTTKKSTYRMENRITNLDVAIQGDASNECKGQATVTKVLNPNENSENFRDRPSELDKVGSKVNGTYYYMEGSSSACSEDKEIQEQATIVRTEWLKQSKSIIAE